MSDYLYDAFEFTDAYRTRLIEMLRLNTNVEYGGTRLFDGSYSHALQIPEELADFIIALKRHEEKHGKFKRMLEIGFAAGVTNTILNKFFKFEEIVAIDVLMGPPAGNAFWANMRFKNLTFVVGDSASDRIKRIAASFAPYDLVFIDGDHAYEAVKRDFETFAPMAGKSGVVALHDVATGFTGVPKFWQELRKAGHWQIQEFVCDRYQQPFGIGMCTAKI